MISSSSSYDDSSNSSSSYADALSSQASAKSSGLTISPPSYSVRESIDGKFYNDTLKLEWPARPKEGYYSIKEYYHRKEEMAMVRNDKINAAFSKAHGTADSVLDSDFLVDDSYKSPKWFLGFTSPLSAAQKVKNGKMAVFYPLAEPELTDIPMNLKPVLIYKNQNGSNYLLPIIHDEIAELWQLKFLSYHTPTFARLKQLMDYLHTVGFIDPKTGCVEAIPYWILDHALKFGAITSPAATAAV